MTRLGPFELRPQARELWARGKRLPLEPEAVDLVAALIRQPGRAVQPDALGHAAAPSHVWHLVAQVNAAMAEVETEGFYIAHFEGQGFAFVMPDSLSDDGAPNVLRGLRLPARVATIFGRDEALLSLDAQLAKRRLVSLVGTGGMGKSTVALALAKRAAPRFEDGSCLVELASVADPRFVPAAVAAALGLDVMGDVTLRLMTDCVRDKQILFVLDSCEHLLEPVARLAEELLANSARSRIVATSREPLLAAGEWVHRLPPIGMPEHQEALTAAQAMTYPALQLFVERAQASPQGFGLSDDNAGVVAALCRRLDGIPLAIELAAARAGAFGIQRLATQLEAVTLTLTGGRRTAPARHRTLAAMLDWSYALLDDAEKAVLNRLSVFKASFTLQAAETVACDERISPSGVVSIVLDLVAKSLLSGHATADESLFRLLDTTRAYAAARLADSGEASRTRRQHANHLCCLLEEGETAWSAMTRADWRARYSTCVDDVRAALVWAFSPEGDDELGIRLTIATYAMADQTGAMSDYSQFAERALELLRQMPSRKPLLEMRLTGFPANVSKYLTEQPGHVQDLLRSLDVARATGRPHDTMARLVALWATGFFNGDYPQALFWVDQMDATAREHADPIAALIAGRTRAQTLHFLGDHAQARLLAEGLLADADQKIPLAYEPSPVGLNVSMRVLLARILWMQGFAEQARLMARDCVERAADDSPIGLCQALAVAAVPIALWSGDDSGCRAWTEQLGRHVKVYSFAHWESWWVLYGHILAWRESRHGPRFDAFPLPARVETKLRDLIGTFDLDVMAEDSGARVESGAVGWCAPEVLRVQAERILAGRPQVPEVVAQARGLLSRAQALARRQGALAWELRVAMSVARLPRRHGRSDEARQDLLQVFERFTEGFDTADLRSAASLLAELAQS